MKANRLISLLLTLYLFTQASGQALKSLERFSVSEISNDQNCIDNPVTIKVIYDNYVLVDGMKEDWGYSICIDGLEKQILFDTGTKPEIFESNFRKMSIDADKIDYLVLSHEHGDHTGGIPAFVKMKKDIPVIIPQSFSEKFKIRMSGLGLTPLLVSGPAKICKGLYTSGEFDYQIPEQALILNTKMGLVVITGCSHPGIVEMLTKIKSDFGKNIYMVFGGFHLLAKSDKEMENIISEMKALGVVRCGATHCTGDKQIKMIREAFKENYFGLGAGNTIVIQ
jgi:7,8-dihydropterin-6-yl-methyl-4-(beta-D-ribofuranosyl)aminobenzene 5'-phosphate synthase